MEDSSHPDERSQKQIFLKENIIELGYNKEIFADYIANAKENGIDIDWWTLKELKQLVFNFQDSYQTALTHEKAHDDSYEYTKEIESPEEQEYEIKENNDIENVQSKEDFIEDFEKIDISQIDKENIDGKEAIRKTPIWDFEDTNKISDLTALNKMDDTYIEITDAVHNPGGLFSFSYVEYNIDTYPFGWSVARKEQDFIRLREYF